MAGLTKEFLSYALNTLLQSNKFVLGVDSDDANDHGYGEHNMVSTVTQVGTSDTYEWKTTGSVYFDELSSGSGSSISCINAIITENGAKKSVYSIPLQKSVTVPTGYMIKVNPYTETESGGVHIKGIRIRLSLPVQH